MHFNPHIGWLRELESLYLFRAAITTYHWFKYFNSPGSLALFDALLAKG
jgi:hypothetical protein